MPRIAPFLGIAEIYGEQSMRRAIGGNLANAVACLLEEEKP
jgi:hypothetical protein